MLDALSLEERIEWQALQREVDRARLAVEDPEVAALVALALEPLPPDDEDDSPLWEPPRQPRVPFDSIVMPEHVMNAIRQHASTALPDFEVGGRLVVDSTGNAVRYVRLRNVATQPGRFDIGESWRNDTGFTSVVVHTHPHGSDAPSPADLQWGKRYGFRLIGIYAAKRDKLGVFRVAGDLMHRVPVNPEKRLRSLTSSAEQPRGFRFNFRTPRGKRESSATGPQIFVLDERPTDA